MFRKLEKCTNCGGESRQVFRDKVSGKIVCEECKKMAIRRGIRFGFDFEEV